MQVNALGQLVSDKAFATLLNKALVVCPVGYEMELPVFKSSGETPAAEEGDKKKSTAFARSQVALAYKSKGGVDETPQEHVCAGGLYFTGSIEEGPGHTPLFVVSRSDDPSGKRYESTKSISTPWREAFVEAEKDFPERARELNVHRDLKGKLTVLGARLFGLTLSEVVAELKALPGATKIFEELEVSVKKEPVIVVSDSKTPTAKTGKTATAPKAPKGTKGVKSAPTAAGGVKKPTAKRSKKATAASPASDDTEGMTTLTQLAASSSAGSAGPALQVVCPDCGLSGTPFCATTGKPHEAPPCPECGLTSAFCPVTGKPHAGPGQQRANRKRGEVRLPSAAKGTKRTRKGSSATAAGSSGEAAAGVEVVVVSTQDGTEAKSTRQNRKRTRTTEKAAGTEGTKGDSADSSGGGKRQMKIETTSKADNTPLFELLKDEVYVYAPPRPPLSLNEHNKAAEVALKRWREQRETRLLPPGVEALHIPLVVARRPAGAKGRRRSTRDGKDANKDEEDEEDVEDEEGNTAKSPTTPASLSSRKPDDHGAAAETGEEEGGANHDDDASSPPSKDSTGPVYVHPLEVQDRLGITSASKRLNKFVLQYTSERMKMDWLKAATAAAEGGAAAKKRQQKKAEGAHGASKMEGKTEEEEEGVLSIQTKVESDATVCIDVSATPEETAVVTVESGTSTQVLRRPSGDVDEACGATATEAQY